VGIRSGGASIHSFKIEEEKFHLPWLGGSEALEGPAFDDVVLEDFFTTHGYFLDI